MIDRIPLLGGVLILQAVLAGILTLGGGEDGDPTQFLEVDPSSVTRFSLADGDGVGVDLTRVEDDWQFEDGIPADTTKVDDVIRKLAGSEAAWPVATSTSSQTRFEVTEDSHQRQLTLGDGDSSLARIYLGTSPGYRRVHARTEGEDAIYSIDFANHEVPTSQDDWLDKTLLHSGAITSVALGEDWQLTESDDGWLVDGEPADPEAAEKLVERLQELRVMGFYRGDRNELGEQRRLQVVDEQGSYGLSLSHDTENDEYLIASDRVDGEFILASYAAEQILLTADDLTASNAAGQPVAPESTQTP
jgi:hypothetical protein